ncbi:MAG: DUF4397 domain-containing protein [Terriglobales bacterium]|jgi:hypothetical protein
MLRRLKALPLLLAIAALSIVATSCSSGNTTKARIVNAMPNIAQYGGALDIEVNGTQQFSGVTFGTASASTYTNIPSGNVTFEVFQSPGVTTPVFSASTTLSAGTEYTLVATGAAGGAGSQAPALLSFSDDNTLPVDGTINFRVINAALNASPSLDGSVDIWIEPYPDNNPILEPATIQNLAYQSASGYVSVPYNPGGGGFAVYVYTVGKGFPLITPYYLINVSGSQTSASVCTLVLVDSPNSNSMSPSPVPLNDNNCAVN